MARFYTCEQIARRYGVTVMTVWDWIRKKRLGAIKIGKSYRVSADDVKAFEQARKTL